MTKPKIIDLDEELDLTPEDELPTLTIKLFGREWHLLAGVNFFGLAEATDGTVTSVAAFLRNAVIEEERDDWANALASSHNLNRDQLEKLFQRIVEVQTDRPTDKPASKPRPATKRTSSPKSAASSSSARAARSTR